MKWVGIWVGSRTVAGFKSQSRHCRGALEQGTYPPAAPYALSTHVTGPLYVYVWMYVCELFQSVPVLAVSVPACCPAVWRCSPGSREIPPRSLCRPAGCKRSALGGRQRAAPYCRTPPAQSCSSLRAAQEPQPHWPAGTHLQTGKGD